jgi:hypothetical protein
VKKVFHADTDLVFAAYRTQLFNSADIANVRKVQVGYKAQPLSAFLGRPAPKAAPPIDFFKALSSADEKTSLKFFNELNFLLKFCPTDPSEIALMARFAKIGVGAGNPIDVSSLSPAMKEALLGGMADAWAAFVNLRNTEVETGKVTSGDVFGTRAFLKNNYLVSYGCRSARHLRQF